jgi:hypothetical protein
MKHIPINKEIIKIAFDKERDLYKQLDELASRLHGDDFWKRNISREFHLPDHKNYNGLEVGKIGDVWRCDFIVNRVPVEACALWRDYPNYYGSGDGKTMEEVLELSETEKILYNCKDYRIVLLRDEILGNTNNYWGYRIQKPVYALIDDKTNKVIVREPEKWRFEKILTNTLKEQEVKSFIDALKTYNPFKLFFVKSTDLVRMSYIERALKMNIDTPQQYYEKYINKENIWVCYAFALGTSTNGLCKNTTWWFVEQENKPTYEEAIFELLHILNWYNTDSFVDMLIKLRDDLNYDLNKIDLEEIEFFWRRVHEKFIYKALNLFNLDKLETLNEIIEYYE